jgi:hypothetical protein
MGGLWQRKLEDLEQGSSWPAESRGRVTRSAETDTPVTTCSWHEGQPAGDSKTRSALQREIAAGEGLKAQHFSPSWENRWGTKTGRRCSSHERIQDTDRSLLPDFTRGTRNQAGAKTIAWTQTLRDSRLGKTPDVTRESKTETEKNRCGKNKLGRGIHYGKRWPAAGTKSGNERKSPRTSGNRKNARRGNRITSWRTRLRWQHKHSGNKEPRKQHKNETGKQDLIGGDKNPTKKLAQEKIWAAKRKVTPGSENRTSDLES